MLIQVDDVVKLYHSPFSKVSTPALRGISFTVQKGEIVLIRGPNGSGKSTLLNLICGIDTPDSGNIVIDGVNLTKAPERISSNIRSEQIGFIRQMRHQNIFPHLSVRQNVELIQNLKTHPTRNKKSKVLDLLKRFQLDDKENLKARNLSGGEAQRLAIAIALVHKPSILLADEPTGELDEENTRIVLNYLYQLNEESSLTICLVSHNRTLKVRTSQTITLEDGIITENEISQDSRVHMVQLTSSILQLPNELLQLFRTHRAGCFKKGKCWEFIPISPASIQELNNQKIVVLSAQGELNLPNEVYSEIKDHTQLQLRREGNRIIIDGVEEED